MLSLVRVVLVEVFIHSNRTLRKTESTREQDSAATGLTLLLVSRMWTLGLWIKKAVESFRLRGRSEWTQRSPVSAVVGARGSLCSYEMTFFLFRVGGPADLFLDLLKAARLSLYSSRAATRVSLRVSLV